MWARTAEVALPKVENDTDHDGNALKIPAFFRTTFALLSSESAQFPVFYPVSRG
jgi:hypothetical protein